MAITRGARLRASLTVALFGGGEHCRSATP